MTGTIESAGSAMSLLEIIKKSSDSIVRLKRIFEKDRGRILILGAGGVGKTTLGIYLSHGDSFPVQSEYKESRGNEKHELGTPHQGILMIAPGQGRRIRSFWPELFEAFQKKGILNYPRLNLGIIHITSYGYHNMGGGEPFRIAPAIGGRMKRAEYLAAYLEEKRELELEILEKHIVPEIRKIQDKVWMITFVTKEDLWFDEKEKVKAHYCGGKYNHLIQSLVAEKQGGSLDHEYHFGSNAIHNFITRQGELLKSPVKGYDERKKYQSLSQLSDAIEGFFGKNLLAA